MFGRVESRSNKDVLKRLERVWKDKHSLPFILAYYYLSLSLFLCLKRYAVSWWLHGAWLQKECFLDQFEMQTY